MSEPSIAWLTLLAVAAVLSRLRYGLKVQVGILLVGVSALIGAYRVVSIPLPRDVGLPVAAEVFDREGRLIGSYSKVRRFIVDPQSLPDHVAQAVVAAEDHDYFSHGGFSPRAMLRAMWSNVTSFGIREGGSTITQQYVKNALLQDHSRTVVRKVKEAVLAVKLEEAHSKDQILGFYLNTIYLGRGAYGIEAAARSYFDKPATDLTVDESAYLAGIIRAPEAYQADEHPDRAKQRRDAVLDNMVELGFLARQRAARLSSRPVGFEEGIEERSRHMRAAYLMEWLRREHLYPRFGECLYTCGLKIHTTLDLDLQRFAEKAVARRLRGPAEPEAALVALTPTGEVRAFVGGRSFSDAVSASGFSYASDLPGRAAGSVLKPFTLLAALEHGMTTSTVMDGSGPAEISSPECRKPDGRSWSVSNYGGASYSALTLDRATVDSVNTVYARMIEKLGPETVAKVVSRAGFDRKGTRGERSIEPLCSLALGSLDVTPVEVARAYAGLASGGRLPQVSPIRSVEDQFGTCLLTRAGSDETCEAYQEHSRTMIGSRSAVGAVDEVLTHVVDSGTGRAAALEGFRVAGKTGTSQNNTDAWFAGYTEELVATVWVGHPIEGGRVPQMRGCDRSRWCRPLRGEAVTGGSVPADIWADFMASAMGKLAPEVVVERPVPVGRPVEHTDVSEEDVPAKPAQEAVEPDPEPSPEPSEEQDLIPIPLPTP